jgi:hypothetical protein
LRMPTKQYHGITNMSVSRSRELTIRRHTASMARGAQIVNPLRPGMAQHY